uniref:Uncharacterized protein n=1 Tax=Rhizophora mucronata TaxID=61149 RepID=A0A2P2QNN4_RHIMU
MRSETSGKLINYWFPVSKPINNRVSTKEKMKKFLIAPNYSAVNSFLTKLKEEYRFIDFF